jgi:hypothetical protein
MVELGRVVIAVVVAGALLAVATYLIVAVVLVVRVLLAAPPRDLLQDELDAFLVEVVGPRDGAIPAAPPARNARTGLRSRLSRRHARWAQGRELAAGRAARARP